MAGAGTEFNTVFTYNGSAYTDVTLKRKLQQERHFPFLAQPTIFCI